MQRRVVIALGTLLAWCHCAFALDPRLDVSQYAHTAWKASEGLANGRVTSIAQTPDGYLWLGTEFGLLRFDGVRSKAWQAPPGEALPGTFIRRLVAAKDGRLWIGTDKGLASFKDGKIAVYAELAGLDTVALLEDRDGTIWTSGSDGGPNRKLCSIRPGSTHCDAGNATFGPVYVLYQDTNGNLWAGAKNGLWRLRPGTPERYPVPDAVISVAEGDHGAILISTTGGIRQLVDGKIEAYAPANHRPDVNFTRLFKDRDGGLWMGTAQRGILHVHEGRADVFSLSEGLSSDYVAAFFEDREGSIWVATPDGLDRFRNLTVPTLSAKQGLSNGYALSVLAARDGSIWLGTVDGLNRWKDGEITIYRKHARGIRGHPAGAVREVVDDRLPDGASESLFEDVRGRIWVSTPAGIAYFESGRFVPVPGVLAGRNIWSMAGDSVGNVWISADEALFHLGPGATVERIPWSMLGRKAAALALAPDATRGGLWIGFRKGGVAYWKDGRVRRSFTNADGLGDGVVEGLRLAPGGTLWAATAGGLSRLEGDRFATLTSKNGLPCDAVHWLLEEDDLALWLGTACGLVRISRSELEGWIADPSRSIRVALFDTSDGVRSRAITAQYSPQAAKSKDGRLWFVVGGGVSVVDPRHLPVNGLLPPVHVEQIVADRKTYEASSHVRLPPLVRDLQIDYTALSFVAPEKVQFRYKLEGRDRDWQDAGNRRQAFYTDLDPGNYRFRVIACNNSGVWNEEGASLDFTVPPAWWQTLWFRIAGVALAALVLWTLYVLRVRQIRANEAAVRASEARFRTFVDHAMDAFFLFDEQLKVVDVNRQACENLGFSREELIGKRPVDFEAALDERSIEQLAERAGAGETITVETRHRRKDGTEFPVEIRSGSFKQGGRLFYLSLARDITERKLAEETVRGKDQALQMARTELARVSRVTTLGELTTSIAHEVNQPLAAMVANAAACVRWLMAQPPNVDKAMHGLESISADGKRAGEIIGRIRALTKGQPPSTARLDVKRKILDVLALTEEELRNREVAVETRLEHDLPPVSGDRVQLQQVLLNLIVNAMDAMDAVHDRPRTLTIVSKRDGANAVTIEVRDSGIGLDAAAAERLFEAFYTTKSNGIGIGLSISRSIIEAHGGRLWAEPNAPHGAVFSFSLPVVQDEENNYRRSST